MGLTYLNTQMRRALGTCTLPDLLFEKALALEHRRTKVEQQAYLEERRRSSSTARQLTRNGSTNAAVTRISPLAETVKPIGQPITGGSYFTSGAPFC